MEFRETRLDGVWLIEPTPHCDERGFLARTFCKREFSDHGLNHEWPQCNLTLTRDRGSIRGMHYQASPHPEIKLVRCAAGIIYDVLVDVRPTSPTYCKWQGFELSADNNVSLYVPEGIAHGFQCLTDDCRVFYQMSEFFYPELARGIRWDDPNVAIDWPLEPTIISDRDRALPTVDSLAG